MPYELATAREGNAATTDTPASRPTANGGVRVSGGRVMHDERWAFVPDPKGLDDYWWYNEVLSERKRYLFMAAVGRQVVHLMDEPVCIRAVDTCEEFAEGIVGEEKFCDVMEEANDARCASQSTVAAVSAAHAFLTFLTDGGKLHECVEAAELAFGYVVAANSGDLPADTEIAAWQAIERYPSFRAGRDSANRRFTELCLDIFSPNPFAQPVIDPSWRTSTVLTLASQMYESRDFAALPVLADALQDAGCEDEQLLSHCRGPGPHVRGCWVVDLVLGKS